MASPAQLSTVRVLLCGDVEGHLATLAKNVETSSRKQGKYDFVLCVGRFFDPKFESSSETEKAEDTSWALVDGAAGSDIPPELLAVRRGEIRFSIPVKIVDSSTTAYAEKLRSTANSFGQVIAPNLEWLGDAGFRDIAGLKVAFWSGRCASATMTREAEAAKLSGLVDVFASCQWPMGVDAKLSPEDRNALLELRDSADEIIEDADRPVECFSNESVEFARMLEPRFHISGNLGVFYQRPPYRGPQTGLTCRFIGLGSCAPKLRKDKRFKPLHLLHLVPISRKPEEAISPSLALGASPFSASDQEPPTSPQKRQRELSRGDMSEKRSRNVEEPSSIVFVNNIPYDVDQESFYHTMQHFGEITSLRLPRSESGRAVGKAWVTFREMASAVRAVESSEHLESGDRVLRLAFSVPRNRELEPRRHSLPVDTRPQPDCWFCLSNVASERRLVVHVGEQVYLAAAKGGIVSEHILVVPISHIPSIVMAPMDVRQEIQSFIQLAEKCYASNGLRCFVFERFFPMRNTKAMHTQIQIIPIPGDRVSKALSCFQARASACSMMFTALSSGVNLQGITERISDPHTAYFYIQVPTLDDKSEGENRSSLSFLHISDAGTRMPINFGREVAAEVLDREDRINWQACVASEGEEAKVATTLRKLFSGNF